MSKEVFRGVNRYVNYVTGKEELRYTKGYPNPGPAKSMATRMKNQTPWFGNLEDRKPGVGYGIRMDDFYSFYVYVESWCERAVEWERI